MKKILNLLAVSSLSILTVSTTTVVVSCGKEDYMVKLYELHKPPLIGQWVSSEDEGGPLIIEVDKRQIKKYTFEPASTIEGTQIMFYFKDGTTNNTNDKYWSGPASAYENYFTRLLGFGPDIEQE